ncbi:eprA1 [Symbiodinium microadriaticum]|nr:eprA1 [Symbiodinium microadriaticum]
MVERVANLFRIYPTERPGASSSEDDDEDEDEDDEQESVAGFLQTASGMTPSQARLNKQKEELAKAYMGIVIRAFSSRQTQAQMSRWFGTRAFSDQPSRKEILRVLNSVDHMISNVVYVYPGPKCKPNTYAYVYPQAYTCNEGKQTSRPCTTMRRSKKYVFYLCPLYFQRPAEMVETLVHEGSHHATAFTDDVDFEGGTAYGRSTCQKLARADPALALKNADNFCYYIQDTATQTSDSRPAAGPDGSGCPSFASVSHPDRDGDCKCPQSKQCFYEGSLGCPFSYTATKNTYSPAYFTAQCKTCTCETKIETTTTTTTTALAIGAAKSRCPAFAAVRTPDSEGDCSCYGQMVCTFRGDVGCPYARTHQTGRYSDLYFHSSCSECLCARRPAKPIWKEASRCPSSALTRAPDSEGDCHCPRYHLCSYENETGCPVAAGPTLHSHRYFDVNCTGCWAADIAIRTCGATFFENSSKKSIKGRVGLRKDLSGNTYGSVPISAISSFAQPQVHMTVAKAAKLLGFDNQEELRKFSAPLLKQAGMEPLVSGSTVGAQLFNRLVLLCSTKTAAAKKLFEELPGEYGLCAQLILQAVLGEFGIVGAVRTWGKIPLCATGVKKDQATMEDIQEFIKQRQIEQGEHLYERDELCYKKGQGFTKGLHPSADVFEDEEEQPDGAPQQSACDKGDEATECDPAVPELGDDSPCENRAMGSPPYSHGDVDPEAPTSPVCSENDGTSPASEEYKLGEEDGEEQGDVPVACDKEGLNRVPEPVGEPSKLTAQQRPRLHELLRTRDSEGRVPYGLDRYADDDAMWAAYRQGMKASYRAHRKRKRADGTWD